MASIPTQEPVEVATATETEEEQVIDTIVLAFNSDPMMRWFYPSSSDYLHQFPELVRRLGGKAFDHGTAHHLHDFAAAALWLPPDVHPDEEAIAAHFQHSLPEERQAQALSVLEKLDGYHPTEPFWYLPFIGTDPTQQRKGYGSALMDHVLDTCDRAGAIAYLESSNPLNISLYARHGFEILGMIREDTMPTLIPMAREPQV